MTRQLLPHTSCGISSAAVADGFELNGADVFMLAMDRNMRRHGSVGNICHLLVTLAPTADLESVYHQLLSTQLATYASQLRLSQPLFRSPRWRISHSSELRTLCEPTVQSEADLQEWILSHRVDLHCDAPFGIVMLPSYHVGPSLVFYWHHSLCDAHGGELLVRALATEASEAFVAPKSMQLETLWSTLRRAQQAKRVVFEKATGSIARLPSKGMSTPLRRYVKVRLSSPETARVDQVSMQRTGDMFSSALYLASTARAYASLTGSTQPLFIPVPHDMRRLTRERSPLSNQVSVVFFRCTSAQLLTLESATNAAIEQLHDAITTEAPRAHLSFLRIVRRLPTALLWRIIEAPARGHPASLYVSDIGSTLSTITNVRGHEVVSATHYPPNLAPPGLTCVWSRYRDQLELTVCYDEARISCEAVGQLIASIKGDLISHSSC